MDVKDDPKHYGTLNEALHALTEFREASLLPPPSALVFSGGGMHVYWISEKALTVQEWRLYAEGLRQKAVEFGLKCDAGLTTDAARVLRVPGTLNKKEAQPRPVKLAHLGDDYDFGVDLARLATPASSPPTPVSAVVTRPNVQFDLSGWAPPAAKFASLNPQADNLATGLNSHAELPLHPAEIFKNCNHFRDTFLTHGSGQIQGLWMQTVLASTWFEDGRRIAHTLSKGYATYTKDETDAMFDRKLKDRAEMDLGWPACKTFENEGAQCKGCPFYGKLKSPLNLALPTPQTVHDSDAGQRKTEINPVAALMTWRNQGAVLESLLLAMNETFAVVKYGSKVMVATIIGKDLDFMKLEDFHNLLANLVVHQEIETKDRTGTPQKTTRPVIVSKYWFKWKQRRQYVGRGAVFEPGGPLEVPNDMLNLWRGFGIEPKQGDWSPMRNHIHDVICSDNEEHYQPDQMLGLRCPIS